MKYQHLLNLDKQRLIMLGGIPATGKSTIAKDFEAAGYKVFCPDTYRGIISKTKPGREHWTDAMHEGDQSASGDAWSLAYKEAIEALANGHSIIFDAMLQTQKARRSFAGQMNKAKLPIYSVYVVTELQTALDRNQKRHDEGRRSVPDFVIKEKWRTQVIPQKEEGFEEIIIVDNDLNPELRMSAVERSWLIDSIIAFPRKTIEDLKAENKLKDIFPSLDACWNVSQHNRHHNLTISEHVIKAAELVEDRSPVAVISTLLHDVGKVRTKEFFVKIIAENEYFEVGEKVVAVKDNGIAVTVQARSYQGKKGLSESLILLPLDIIEKDPDAHFYDHDIVGALIARRDLLNLGFDEDFANEVYAYILYHMELPYELQSNNSMKKLINKVSPRRMPILLAIRKADKLSSNTGQQFLDLYEDLIAQIKQINKEVFNDV